MLRDRVLVHAGFVPYLALTLYLAANGCDANFRECTVPADAVVQLPSHLSETGLYSDIATGTLADGVRRFTPHFPLWSDGAEKQRFIFLPDGARIDTSDMDDWQFPIGTKLWKQFTRDNVRVETRLEQKLGPAPSDWALVAYVWNADETEAQSAVDGERDAHGTPHDVPRATDCIGCHGGRKSRVLGFSAVQLAAAGDADSGGLRLTDLIDSDLLTDPPATEPRVPGTEAQVAGLGYLHANCGHCHNQIRPVSDRPRCYDPEHSFELALRVNDLGSVASTAAVRTGVGKVIEPDDVDHSKILKRMRVRDPDLPSMPPLGTEEVDKTGVAIVRAFIASL